MKERQVRLLGGCMVVGNSVQVVFADARFIGSPNANITSLSISMRC